VIGYPSRRTPRVAADTTDEKVVLGPRALFVGSTLLLTVVAFVRPVLDPDYWMHLRVGRWIVENRRLPDHDLFTYTVPDHRWVDHEYLSQLLFWGVHSLAGPAGVSILVGLATWVGMVLVLAAARPSRQPYVIVGMAAVLAALAGGPTWGPRPQMFTFVLASLELLWLRRSLEGTSRAILWLPLVMVLWSNLHGGWAIAFLFLGVAMVSEAVAWVRDRARTAHLAQLRRLALVGVASALAVPLNPNGLAVLLYPLQTLGSGAQQGLIAEWQSPDFHMVSLRPFGLMLLLTVAALAIGRPRLFDSLLALSGIALALQSDRNIPLFVAAATPVLVTGWGDAWRRLRPASPVAWNPKPPARVRSVATLLVLALVAGIIGTRTAQGLIEQPQRVGDVVPVGAADWLAAHPDVGTRMFNEYSWGDYLADRFYPRPNRRVFMFSEGVVMGDDMFYRYQRIASLGPGWQRELDATGVDYVVFPRGSALDDVLATEPGWRQVYHDRQAVIYVRAARPPT
jgi:hypothetical protein